MAIKVQTVSKLYFHFYSKIQEFSTDEEKLLALFTMRKELRLGDVEDYLHVSRNPATRKLNMLIKAGKIKRYGKDSAVKYVLH